MPYARSLLIALTLSLAVAAPAHAARGMEVALEDEGVFLPPGFGFSQTTAFSRARQLQVSTLRSNIGWAYTSVGNQGHARTKPGNLAYNFTRWDSLVNNARAHGLKVQLALTTPAPAWATANHKLGNYKPSAGSYGQWVAAAVRHFHGRVARYAVLNEPNFVGWLQPQSTAPEQYRRLYQAAYAAIRKYDPSAQILIGETAPYYVPDGNLKDGPRITAPLDFLKRLGCVTANYKRKPGCTTLKADGYAQHPYEYLHAPTYRRPDYIKGRGNTHSSFTTGTLDRLTYALDKLNKAGTLKTIHGGKMPVYLTEYGYFTKPGDHRNISEARRAKYLPEAFAIAARNPRVKQLLQYQLVQPKVKQGSNDFLTYLIKTNGTLTASFTALQKWAARAAASGAIKAAP